MMNETTYIGERYVPIFAVPSEWDISRQYENLMMVTNDGKVYISKKYVNPGISLENTEYWVKISVPEDSSGGGGGYQYNDITPVDTGNKWIHGEPIFTWKFNNNTDNYTITNGAITIPLPSQLRGATLLKVTVIINSLTIHPIATNIGLDFQTGTEKLILQFDSALNGITYALDNYLVIDFVEEVHEI